MDELFGKSLVRSWSEQGRKWTPGARRKFASGTIILGLGVLLQFVGGRGHSLLGVHIKVAELVLMALGLMVHFWGLVDQSYNSSRGKT